MKKCILIICLLCLILTGCYDAFDLYDATPEGYIDKVEHFDKYAWMDSTDYAYYKYSSDGEKLFKNNGDFLKVKKDDIDVLVKFYENFKEWMSLEERESEFDMKKTCITEGDYYRIENWWYGEAEQKDCLSDSWIDDDESEDDNDKKAEIEIKPIEEEGRIRLVKTDEKNAVKFSLMRYYNLYIYDTESSTLYYLHNDT